MLKLTRARLETIGSQASTHENTAKHSYSVAKQHPNKPEKPAKQRKDLENTPKTTLPKQGGRGHTLTPRKPLS
jgi:hypothetical protein